MRVWDESEMLSVSVRWTLRQATVARDRRPKLLVARVRSHGDAPKAALTILWMTQKTRGDGPAAANKVGVIQCTLWSHFNTCTCMV
jgi:hypothetical protein